jgi:hypothetical protein
LFLVLGEFMPLGVLGKYGKILLAFSPYVLKYFLRILRNSLNTVLSAYSETVLCTANFAVFSCTLKYFPRILRLRRTNGEYAERNFYF